MRLVFFGSDVFALPALEALVAAGHELALAVTNPDRRRGRSKALLPTPIKETALRLGAPVEQPEERPGRALAARIAEVGAELGVVVAYGQFLTKRVREAPSLGYSINLHGSLLPRWRGAAPVAAALLAGDPVTGVSVQRVEQRMDAGPLLLSREEVVRPDDDRGALRDRLSQLGAELLVEAVAAIARGEAAFVAQDEALATLAPKLSKEDGQLDLAGDAARLAREVRAFTPWPGAFLTLAGGERVQVVRALALETPSEGPSEGTAPGTVLALDKERESLRVAAGSGALELLTLKPVGKRDMSGLAFANGRRLKPGDRVLA
ncbi:MAG: methionyl-tRNA formyltransferase [Planctomycetota bacterium]